MKVLCYYLKEVLLKEFSKKREMCTLLLKFQYQTTNLLINLLNLSQRSGEKEKEISDYKMTYSRLINSMRWKFDSIFFEKKKKMENTVLEKLCNKVVDVINETFIKNITL